ncbi:unnamed protein product, partial [Nesidiocoris tenuis]
MHVIKPVALQFIKLASNSHQASSMGQSSSQFHDSHQANSTSHQDDLAMSSNHSNQEIIKTVLQQALSRSHRRVIKPAALESHQVGPAMSSSTTKHDLMEICHAGLATVIKLISEGSDKLVSPKIIKPTPLESHQAGPAIDTKFAQDSIKPAPQENYQAGLMIIIIIMIMIIKPVPRKIIRLVPLWSHHVSPLQVFKQVLIKSHQAGPAQKSPS